MAFPVAQLGPVLGHPVLSVFLRAVLEDALEAVRATVRRHLVLDRRLRTLELGPLSREEMDWMGRVGEHVHLHSRKFFMD